jgi:ABC-2 type transport system ATP-binding protein
MIAVDNLRKSYGDFRAVDDISFTVERGETFALLGPNGAGKTTTIEILEGFLDRDAGTAIVAGLDPGRRENIADLRRKVGVLLQKTALEPELSVLETVEAFRRYYADPIPAHEVLDLVSLSEQRDRRVGALSGGQLRRLDIALSVLGRPEVLFLDEPTTGLDPAARRRIWQLIRNLNANGATILLSSHYLDEVEALAHRLIVLSRGRIVASGGPAALRESLAGETIVRLNETDAQVVSLLPRDIAAAARRSGAWVEFRADDATQLIQTIASVASRNGRSLRTMVVVRPSLEDFYLDLLEREEAQKPQ